MNTAHALNEKGLLPRESKEWEDGLTSTDQEELMRLAMSGGGPEIGGAYVPLHEAENPRQVVDYLTARGLVVHAIIARPPTPEGPRRTNSEIMNRRGSLLLRFSVPRRSH